MIQISSEAFIGKSFRDDSFKNARVQSIKNESFSMPPELRPQSDLEKGLEDEEDHGGV